MGGKKVPRGEMEDVVGGKEEGWTDKRGRWVRKSEWEAGEVAPGW